MKVQEFIDLLKANQGKALLFEYSDAKFAGTNYHLTEVKNVTFETVDCGGNTNAWQETHIQLWESPIELGKKEYISTDKALSIINRVDKIKPLHLKTEAKIEFGNDSFHTAIMSIEDVKIDNDKCIIKLFANKTECKALDTCGQLQESTSEGKKEEVCCSGSGCC